MRLSGLSATEAADAVCALLDGGFLDITDGQKRLVRLRFASPAFEDAVNGVATARRIKAGTADASGTVSGFQAISFGDSVVFEGSAGVEGTDLVVSKPFIDKGAPVSVLGFEYKQPRE